MLVVLFSSKLCGTARIINSKSLSRDRLVATLRLEISQSIDGTQLINIKLVVQLPNHTLWERPLKQIGEGRWRVELDFNIALRNRICRRAVLRLPRPFKEDKSWRVVIGHRWYLSALAVLHW